MKYLLLTLLIGSSFLINGQIQNASISFNHYRSNKGNTSINFAVKGNESVLRQSEDIHYKYKNGNWHFIYCSPHRVAELMKEGIIKQLYFDPSVGHLLNDTMRIVQNVDSVHDGHSPLQRSFTGKDVVLGYIDSGLDHNHEDFKNEDGTTRVLYYWDHSLGIHPDRTPGKYGYGQVWTSEEINDGSCTSTDENAHGTTVTGAGSGNGRATGTNQGVAPESDIIIVETNFSLPNWTLTVADGIDFIFSMADTLGKPAVVNTSVGSYFGSHDGTDPASQIIDSLLMDKPGRIVVGAAGNSGAQGKYHVKGSVDTDTSFTWFDVNPASAFGGAATYFDLWSDTADFKNVHFAFGADQVSPSFEFRGRTNFYTIEPLLGTTTYDTIFWEGNRVTPVEFYAEEINGVYHLEMVMLNPDSLDFYYRFETTGDGVYDLWSGAWAGASNIVHLGLPSPIDFPPIANYHMPDSLSTIVSSWTCSPKVVTVGNFKNQYDYIDYLGEPYVLGGGPPGELSPNSSKGPNRRGVVKPDVSATGDGIMSACPLWLSASLKISNPSMLAEGGEHVRNGGTSMASPVIAGIAALYLEKCSEATYQDFLNDLHELAYSDDYTGITPNTGYGYGKVDAFELLNHSNYSTTLLGDTLICATPEVYELEEGPFTSYEWFNDETGSSVTLNETANVYAIIKNDKGCIAYTDTLEVVKGTMPIPPSINQVGGGLVSTPAANYQWYFNGEPIDDSNTQFLNPDSSGSYVVEVISEDGCSLFSEPIIVESASIEEMGSTDFLIFPNPFQDELKIIKGEHHKIDVSISDVSGKQVYFENNIPAESLFITFNLSHIENGVYILTLYYENNFSTFRVIKQ